MTEIGKNFNLEELRVFMEAAKERHQTAIEKQTVAHSSVETAETNITNAEAVKSQAQDAKTSAEEREIEAQAAKEKEESDVQTAMRVVNSINSRINVLSFRYTSILSQLNILYQDSEKNKEQIDNLNRQLDELNNEINAAKAELTEAMAALEREKSEAEEAGSNLQKAETEVRDTTLDFEKAETEYNESLSDLEEAENDAAKADEEAEAAEEEYTEAQANYDNAVKEAENNNINTENVAHLSEQDAIDAGYTIIPANISGEDLIKLLSSNLDGKFIMMGDINLEGINWTPIGDAKSPFRGEFNGNGFDINNLKISNGEEVQNVGFFGVTENATVTNVNFVDAKIETSNDIMTGSSFVGVVAGLARGTEFNNISISGDLTGYEGIGGLAGKINDNNYLDENFNLVIVNNSSIKNVQTDVAINSSFYTGGLIGYIEGTQTDEGVATKFMTIDNCSTSGSALISEESCGGLIGEAGKTIITINGCTSSMDLTWNNDEDDSNMSFLMETGRVGGIIGNASGTYLTLIGNDYTGKINAEGDFKGPQYGWYMNDAQISIYDIQGGLPVDDILNIQGIDALTPVINNGVPHYEVTVSTLTGLDKMVTMIQDNPRLADLVTFNVNFDFEAMDGMYDNTVYAQYGVIQHLYEDEEGNVVNDVYIDNEIDLETTFRGDFIPLEPCCEPVELVELTPTMVSGLYKNENKEYVVITEDGIKNVDLNFNYENQKTNVTKRLTTSETKYRDLITQMVEDYRCKMHLLIKRMFGVSEEYIIPTVNKAQYKKLMKKAEAAGGVANLSVAEQLAIASYQIDYTVMNKVAETTHNQGCGMGGNSSFLDKTSTYQIYDEAGRALYTTLSGDRLVRQTDEEGNPILDDSGNPVYEYADGSGVYEGLDEILEQRGYQTQDENGNLLFTDVNGNTVTQIKDEEGNVKYVDSEGNELTVTTEEIINDDGTANTIVRDADGNILERQLTEYNNSEEYKNLENEMKNMLQDVENGKYPADINSENNEKQEEDSNEDVSAEQTEATSEEEKDQDKIPEEEKIEEAA